MRVQCSNCGAIKGFTYTATNVNRTICEGWGSYGSALYCPKCTKTWYERNNKDLANNNNTIAVIASIHEKNKKRKYKEGVIMNLELSMDEKIELNILCRMRIEALNKMIVDCNERLKSMKFYELKPEYLQEAIVDYNKEVEKLKGIVLKLNI